MEILSAACGGGRALVSDPVSAPLVHVWNFLPLLCWGNALSWEFHQLDNQPSPTSSDSKQMGRKSADTAVRFRGKRMSCRWKQH